MFTVNILLNDMRVLYSPSMIDLTHTVNIVAKDVISIVTAIPRIRSSVFDLTAPSVPIPSPMAVAVAVPMAMAVPAQGQALVQGVQLQAGGEEKSYYEMISDDQDILRLVMAIMNGKCLLCWLEWHLLG